MRIFQTVVATAILLSASQLPAQHDIEDRHVGLRIQLPAGWTNTSSTQFGNAEARFQVILNRDDGRIVELHSEVCDAERRASWATPEHAKRANERHVIEITESDLVPFDQAMVYKTSYGNSAEQEYSGYLAYFSEGDRCFKVMVASPGPFEDETEFFTATLGSLETAVVPGM